jgi:hypothetical protein
MSRAIDGAGGADHGSPPPFWAKEADSRDAGVGEGQRNGVEDGRPEGRVMALILLVRKGCITKEQARARLLGLMHDQRVPLALGRSAVASLERTREPVQRPW